MYKFPLVWCVSEVFFFPFLGSFSSFKDAWKNKCMSGGEPGTPPMQEVMEEEVELRNRWKHPQSRQDVPDMFL